MGREPSAEAHRPRPLERSTRVLGYELAREASPGECPKLVVREEPSLLEVRHPARRQDLGGPKAEVVEERLLLLAVDLPRMTVAFLQRVHAAGDANVSVVPHGSHGYEPLAACYARSLQKTAEAALAGGRLSLQTLMAEAESAGLVRRLTIGPADEGVFANWNTPGDVASA